MALTKQSLTEAVQNQTGVPKNKTLETVESILEIIKGTLASGEDVLISNIGKLQVNEKAERRRRNYDFSLRSDDVRSIK